MKTVFDFKSVSAALGLAALLLATPLVHSKTFFSAKALLLDQFRHAERVTYQRVALSSAERAGIERELGRPLPKPSYAFNVALREGRVAGYALFDSEIGQHQPIDFATFFDPTGKVTRVEVVAYREAYGDGIRSKRFREQFVGKNGGSGFRVGKDVDVVSGATLSSKSMAKAVKRAAVLLDAAVLRPQRATASPP